MASHASYIFSSESVGEGHPDKVADSISDSVLDACFAQDRFSRVACETLVKSDHVVIAGELTTKAKVNFEEVVRAAIREIGSVNDDDVFHADQIFITNYLTIQSPDIAQGVDERLRQFEPVKVAVDGKEFQADPAEKRDFEAALAVFRSGKFPEASTAFAGFVRQYPRSGFVPSARFWLGNAQYATREYKEAIGNFKQMLADAPGHARAPEAALSIANCQIELKDTRTARKTLEDLVRAYPQSEAAVAAKERLSRLK